MGSSWYLNGETPTTPEEVDGAVLAEFEEAAPALPAPEVEVLEAGQIPMYVVRDFEFHSDVVNGFEVVILVMDVDDGVNAGPIAFAMPSEDVIRLARAAIAKATTVRPFSTQEVIKGLDAQIGANA